MAVCFTAFIGVLQIRLTFDPNDFNQRVQGSSPCAPTIQIKHL